MSPETNPIIGFSATPFPCLVLRHGKDKPDLVSSDMNNHLDSNHLGELVIFSGSAVNLYKLIMYKYKYNGVSIIHSPRLRTYETSILCTRIFGEAGIPVDLNQEPLLQELDQGRFLIDKKLMTPDHKYLPLVNAWQAYVNNLNDEEIDYRYGQKPKSDKDRFSEIFISPGESQRELLSRIYLFLQNLLQTDSAKLHIVVTHATVIDELQRIISAIKTSNQNALAYLGDGSFTRKLQSLGHRIRLKPAQAIALSLNDLRYAADILKKESDHISNHE